MQDKVALTVHAPPSLIPNFHSNAVGLWNLSKYVIGKTNNFLRKMAFYWIIGFEVIFDTIILPVEFLLLYLTNSSGKFDFLMIEIKQMATTHYFQIHYSSNFIFLKRNSSIGETYNVCINNIRAKLPIRII